MKTQILATLLIPALLACEGQPSTPKASLNVTEPAPSPTPSPSASPTPPPVVVATNCSISGLGVLSPASIVSNNPRMDYPDTNVIDNNIGTFMTTNGLAMGEKIRLAVSFSAPVNLECLKFSNDFNNAYYQGDMAIYTSVDSTDGSNGTWEYVSTMTAATTYFFVGDGNISVVKSNVKWVALEMTYNGSGAQGGSPSFYLSEVGFHGN